MASVLSGDRRRDRRRSAASLGFAAEAVLRPGVPVDVLELSARGALVEGAAAVRPGLRTELGLDPGDGQRHAVAARVLRCWVCALDPIRYRCAVGFEVVLTKGSG